MSSQRSLESSLAAIGGPSTPAMDRVRPEAHRLRGAGLAITATILQVAIAANIWGANALAGTPIAAVMLIDFRPPAYASPGGAGPLWAWTAITTHAQAVGIVPDQLLTACFGVIFGDMMLQLPMMRAANIANLTANSDEQRHELIAGIWEQLRIDAATQNAEQRSRSYRVAVLALTPLTMSLPGGGGGGNLAIIQQQ